MNALPPPIHAGIVTVLFTDIEGGTRLWEQKPDRMAPVLARHDALARAAVQGNHGSVVKMTGGGVYALFDDAIDAVRAAVQLQLVLADPEATDGISLPVRCGVHRGDVDHRDGDYFGSAINRAARIMGAAHGGQVLLSEAVATHVRERLPEGFGLRELGAVRLRGLETAERVYQIVHPQLRQEFPALGELQVTPNNLPQPTTSFVGREHEGAEIKQLLGHTRLLTLLGPVGIGKTRLARQAAAAMLDDFRDGVWLVDLTEVSDASGAEKALARALSVQEERNEPLQKTLAGYVAPRKMLLIFDNCAHLIEPCARIVDALLRVAAAVRILVTSCEPLRVPGEQTYRLLPLAVPLEPSHVSAQSARAFGAVQLFVDRARLQQPGFDLTDFNAPTVAAICDRLDGIPLAIEVAAAWLGTLALDTIAARVADGSVLVALDGGTAADPERALRARLDRSYNLLSENERLLFNRLSAIDPDLAAAEQICGAPPLNEDDVLDLLTALVDKSLVVMDSEGEQSRYRQFQILRLYAQERAGETPAAIADTAATRLRHEAYLAQLSRVAPPERIGSA